jgi:uncharacterized membrane protein
MSYLISGIIIFFAIHIVPSTQLRTMLVSKIGEKQFKAMFSVITVIGLALIIFGLTEASFQVLWTPPTWARSMLISIMPIVVVLWVVAETPNNIRRFIRHPMLIAMVIWGLGHLVANGDLATTIVFASFASFSLANIFVVNARKPFQQPEPVSWLWDLGTVGTGLILYGIIFYFHGSFTGMPLR